MLSFCKSKVLLTNYPYIHCILINIRHINNQKFNFNKLNKQNYASDLKHKYG